MPFLLSLFRPLEGLINTHYVSTTSTLSSRKHLIITAQHVYKIGIEEKMSFELLTFHGVHFFAFLQEG